MTERYVDYLNGCLEMYLKESVCSECDSENDNADRLCDDCK